MLADTHCHLPNNLEAAQKQVREAEEEGVCLLVNIGTSLEDSREAHATALNFSNVYSTVAVYPHENRDVPLDEIGHELQAMISSSEKVVAVGECGVDLSEWKGGRVLDDQLYLFEMQVELALKNDLPLVLHNRNGDEHILKILNKYKGDGLRGISHCFSSSWAVAQELLDLNFYISFSGMLTYPSRKDLVDVAIRVPLDRFLFETDAPYLPPQPHRGEKNQPKYVKIVAQKFAQARDLSFDVVSRYSYGNTCAIFNLAMPA